MTWIVGGATSGYWAMGRVVRATRPRSTITMERTVAATGRSTKKRANISDEGGLEGSGFRVQELRGG